jgi:hypothetical protein
VAKIQNARSSEDNQLARAFQPTPAHLSTDADANASLMASVVLKNTVTDPPTSASKLVRLVEKARHARESSTTALCANVHQTTSETQRLSAALNATAMSTVPDRNQLASMESARTLVMVLAVSTLTATSVA